MSDNKDKKSVTVAKYGKQTFIESPPINPLTITIETLEVEDKTYAGYFFLGQMCSCISTIFNSIYLNFVSINVNVV
ncbi:hypothetical protein N8251_00230 [Alphaproteobacteria bacterium]|nr:hypothetical protein [Alphaproteobacteria bacterium]